SLSLDSFGGSRSIFAAGTSFSAAWADESLHPTANDRKQHIASGHWILIRTKASAVVCWMIGVQKEAHPRRGIPSGRLIRFPAAIPRLSSHEHRRPSRLHACSPSSADCPRSAPTETRRRSRG